MSQKEIYTLKKNLFLLMFIILKKLELFSGHSVKFYIK